MSKTAATIARPDAFFGGVSSHALRTLQANNWKMGSLRANSTLRKDEWVQLDTAVVEVARQRLNGIADLRNAGLVHSLGSVGVTISQWETLSDMNPAQIDMSGVTRGELDNIEYELNSVPVPVIHKEFDLNWRRRIASQNGIGEGLDTTMAAVSSRLVADGLEKMLFKGADVTVNGKSIVGYTTAPNRKTDTIAKSWAGTADGEEIVTDVLGMIEDAQGNGNHMYGPYTLYVNGSYWPYLLRDYKEHSDVTVLQRILAIPGISAVKPADVLSSKEVVLVQMTRDVVDLAIAEDIQTIDWETMGGRVNHFSVFAVMVPRVKETFTDQSGIVHWSEA